MLLAGTKYHSVAIALAALLLLAFVLVVAPARAGQTATVAAFQGKDKYCDAWNFAKDPDCRNAKYEQESAPTGATGGTGATGPTANGLRGDTIWPAPPGGRYARLRSNGRTAYWAKGTPPRIKKMIRAANSITKKPYVWGGGHGRWYDRGYDCSGAVSFVLRAGGFVSWPMVSGQYANWGSNGPGRWLRIYAHKDHVFMVIAGLRFDTTPWYPGEKGPRWRNTVRGTGNFALRHPVRY